jgi:hypothetical protein
VNKMQKMLNVCSDYGKNMALILMHVKQNGFVLMYMVIVV